MGRPAIIRVFAALMLALFASVTASDVCDGWSASAAGRAECCVRSGGTCASLSADDCCAEGEQRNTRDIGPVPAQPARDISAGPLAPVPVAFPRADVDRPAPGDRPDPHLLHSVFLI